MFKKILLIAVVSFVIFGISKLSLAAPKEAEQTVSKKAVDAGNKICPVSGEKIDEKTKATYEYEGKIYNFCCPACIEIFKKDPQKYINKVEDEVQTGRDMENRTEKLMLKESDAQDTMHQERRGDR